MATIDETLDGLVTQYNTDTLLEELSKALERRGSPDCDSRLRQVYHAEAREIRRLADRITAGELEA